MSRRGVLGVVILVGWVAVLGLHVQREYFVPELERLARATMTLAPETHYYVLEMGGGVVGTGSSQLDTLPDGFRLDDLMILEMEALGDVVLRSNVLLSRTLRLREFTYRLESDAGTFEAQGALEGDTLFRVRGLGADADEWTLGVDEPPIPVTAVPMLVAKSGELRVGRTVEVPVFDPSTLATRPVEVEILEVGTVMVTDSAVYDEARERWRPGPEREIAGWRIEQRFAGVTTESWIDQDGRILSSTSPMGFHLRRTSFELARQARDDVDTLTIPPSELPDGPSD